jgi:hypothetical protein
MKYSNALTEFLKIWPECINDFPSYLGQNWETILNFWSWIDTLTVEQWKTIGEKYYPGSGKTACDYGENLDYFEDVQYCTWKVVNEINGSISAKEVAIFVSYELMVMHNILNAGHELYIIPMFNDL